MVKGRAFFAWLVILAVAAMVTQSAGAWAQSPRVLTVGVLAVDVPGTERFWRLFRDDMRRLGYVDGKTVRYEYRAGPGKRASSSAVSRFPIAQRPKREDDLERGQAAFPYQ